eukprot:TRINITY_DN2693_c1_g1_i4.p1 TRINITY_DN2693_c1_g1~~TRINITY_DN2693_c1_g1_i4.p1  ORF type:complete len:283 (-),score=94.58 TRINITY_DN2693_c1_g1_i4:44-892(-)
MADIASSVITVCQKIWELGQKINQLISDFKEQKENLVLFKTELNFFQDNLNKLQDQIEETEKKKNGDKIIKKTGEIKKDLSEFDFICNWIDEKVNTITILLGKTEGYSTKGGIFQKIEGHMNALKMSNELCNEMKKMTEEFKHKNDQFHTKIFVVQTQLLGRISETMEKVWNAQRQDSILNSTDESTTWFWITSFKSGEMRAKREDFKLYLSHRILEYKYEDDDNKKTIAMEIAEKIIDLIDVDKNLEIDKSELRDSIFKYTGNKNTPFDQYLGTMIHKVGY